jgi:3alpha(or 20beta)-hydroxysteroid dehydrogenase
VSTHELEGRVAIISGGARGQGAAHARILARNGATVVTTDILDDLGEGVAKELRADGHQVTYRNLDVREPAAWAATVEHTMSAHGRLDILVNNAGVCEVSGVAECSDEEWEHVMRRNLYGAIYGTRAAIPAMKSSGGGSIINTASMYAVKGVWGYAAYAASKAGIVGLTKTTAVTHGIDGIRANAICPSAVDTPMLARELELFAVNPDFDFDELVQSQPIRRIAQPEDVAEMVLFLASDRSAYSTGAIFPVDGGALA